MRNWWRKGLRAAVAVLAVAALGAAAACGGGDDDDNAYDFNGTWSMTSVVVQSNVPGVPVGLAGVDVVKVSQGGTTIAVGIEGVPVQTGTCNPEAGTFTVSGAGDGMIFTTTGTAVDENTVAGEWSMIGGPYVVRATYTAELVSRSLAAGAAPAPAGFMAGVAQLLE